jgi:hypothetical protein
VLDGLPVKPEITTESLFDTKETNPTPGTKPPEKYVRLSDHGVSYESV